MESNIKLFIISLLSLSLFAIPTNGRKILEVQHARELMEDLTPELIKELLIKHDTSFMSHSNPWANYWIYDPTSNLQQKDGDLSELKLQVVKGFKNQGEKSFVGHSNPWANYWIYDNAIKKSPKEVTHVKSEEALNQIKLEAIKHFVNKEDKSFVGHSNPWANYWIYDNAIKKLSKEVNIVKSEETLKQIKHEAIKNLIKKEDKSFVGHLNPWTNYWMYDDAIKKLSQDGNNVKIEKDLDETKLEAIRNLIKKEDKSFVGHPNPWANYWIYDNAIKKSSKDVNHVKSEEVLNEFKLEALKHLMKKEDESFVRHSNPWANYWIYDNAIQKLSKEEKKVKSEEKDLNQSNLKETKNVKTENEDLNQSKLEAMENPIDMNDNKDSSKDENGVMKQVKLADVGSVKVSDM